MIKRFVPKTIRFFGRFGLDGFLLWLISLVAVSAFSPDIARTHGILRIDLYTTYGVSVVFFLYGLTISWDRLRAGLLNWRLHLLVLAATFILYPALIWALGAAAGSLIGNNLKLGFFYLAASPSTISSSVAMTSIAGGNVAGAIFNASLSSLVGVFVTPLWISWYLAQAGQSFELGHVILKIVMLVLVPTIAGQALRPMFGRWISLHPRLVRVLDRGTILAIVFNSFSDSVADGIWRDLDTSTVFLVPILSLILFFAVMAILSWVCGLIGFNRADTVAGVFCGTKKSLASGVPMAKVIFGASPALGMIILPFVTYHFLQLVAASIIARRWSAAAGR